MDKWKCPECGDEVFVKKDEYQTIGTPYCADCDCEMELSDPNEE